MPNGELLRLSSISKAFQATVALEEVHFDVREGEVHVLIGENGAGKSTLMKIVAGILQPDKGTLQWRGEPLHLRDPRQARRTGIAMVHQELSLVPQLSIAENIFLGRLPALSGYWLDRSLLLKQARRLMAMVALDYPPDTLISGLKLGERQRVEIARSLAGQARLIIMDEPTAPLTSVEASRLFRLIEQMTAQGVAIIYITHRLDEIREVGQRVTVLRDGRNILTCPAGEAQPAALIEAMAGKKISDRADSEPPPPGRELLRLEQVSLTGSLKDIDLRLRAGEIVSLAGLAGAGRTKLARLIFGAERIDAGKLFWKGTICHFKTPAEAVRAGIGLVSEDRQKDGLIVRSSVWHNITLAAQTKYARWGFFDRKKELKETSRLLQALSIRLAGPLQPAGQLSGGNQQKVLLGRWLYRGVDLLILDEPTRGIDVVTKDEIYRLMRELAGRQLGILMISSDLLEVLTMSDRVVVMREGRITGELDRKQASETSILQLAVGAA